MELTNSARKLVAGLSSARHRRQSGLFKAEGSKCVLSLMPYFTVDMLLATRAWIDSHSEWEHIATPVTAHDMERMSSLTTPSDVIAVFHIPATDYQPETLRGELVLALDSVRDPGNLGTIIRSADWFGVKTILCSPDSVDLYNPKVVQATMGALARVKVHYCDICEAIRAASPVPVYGTFLSGSNIYESSLSATGIVVMGNEGSGISQAVASLVTLPLTIPSYPQGADTSESLNVAVATSIVLSEFRRRL